MQKLTAVTVYKRHIMVVVLLYILLVNNNLFLSVTPKMFSVFCSQMDSVKCLDLREVWLDTDAS